MAKHFKDVVNGVDNVLEMFSHNIAETSNDHETIFLFFFVY